jgi:DNA-binding YbaB/EbfC family protein
MLKGLGNIGGLVKKMQSDLARVQGELKEKVVEAAAGGGMVTAMANGQQEILSVKIDPQAVNADDIEMLEDLIIAAVNQALKKSQELAQEEMKKITGGLGLNIPGLF